MAAVEFALILPVLVLLYLGGVEVTQAIAIDRKVTITARAVADLVAQASNNRTVTSTGAATVLTTSEINDVMNAAKAVMAPYGSSELKVTISGIYVNSSKAAKVSWSRALNTTARPDNQSITLPTALAQPETHLILAEVSYDYAPIFGYVMTSTIVLGDQLYMRPRHTDRICVTSCT